MKKVKLNQSFNREKISFIVQIILTSFVFAAPSVEPKYYYGGEFTSGPGGEFLLNNLILSVITLVTIIQTIMFIYKFIKDKKSKEVSKKSTSILNRILKFIVLIAEAIFCASLPYIFFIALFQGSKLMFVLINVSLILIIVFLNMTKSIDKINN